VQMASREKSSRHADKRETVRSWPNPARTRALEGQAAGGIAALSLEFVVRPGKTAEIRAVIDTVLAPALSQREGFLGILILHPMKEPRQVSLLTFWQGAETAAGWTWKELREAQELLEPLLDCSPRSQLLEVISSLDDAFTLSGRELAVC
jgi:heme-degrading monooxygenase HmoA